MPLMVTLLSVAIVVTMLGVRPGDQVTLLVAQAGPNVLVPNLQGVAEADAVSLLLDADLEPGVRTQAFDADVAVGAVISSIPTAGQQVARGSTVDRPPHPRCRSPM